MTSAALLTLTKSKDHSTGKEETLKLLKGVYQDITYFMRIILVIISQVYCRWEIQEEGYGISSSERQ
jgi:hypothetical protein